MYDPHNLTDFDSQFALLPYLIRSKKTVVHIKQLLNEKNAELVDDYGHKIYLCPKCGVLCERFYLRLEYDGGSYEVAYRCTKCKAVLIKLDADEKTEKINFQPYPCPQCGKHGLYQTISGLWD